VRIPKECLSVSVHARALNANAAIKAVEVGDLVRLVAQERGDEWVGIGRSLEILVDVHTAKRILGQSQGERGGQRCGTAQVNQALAGAAGEEVAVFQAFQGKPPLCCPRAAPPDPSACSARGRGHRVVRPKMEPHGCSPYWSRRSAI